MVTASSIVSSVVYDRCVQTPDLFCLLQIRVVISRHTYLTKVMVNRKVNHRWCMSNDRQIRRVMSDVAVFVVDGASVFLLILLCYSLRFAPVWQVVVQGQFARPA
jgi:hypothetical protein